MMRLLPFLLLLQVATDWFDPVHGFSVSYYNTRPQARAVKSRPKFVKRLDPQAPSLCAGSDSDDDSSPDEDSKNDESSDEEDKEKTSLDDDSDSDKQVSESSDDDKPTFRERLKNLWWKNDDDTLTTRQRLAKMGLAAVLSYGWVSNVSYAICISLAWYGFSTKTGLSPLAPDQWKPFLAVYAGFFVFNNVIRPLRLGLSIALSTYFDRVVKFVQDKTKFNKSISIAIVVFFFNIVGTISLMMLGITLASLASGVPVFPGKAAK